MSITLKLLISEYIYIYIYIYIVHIFTTSKKYHDFIVN